MCLNARYLRFYVFTAVSMKIRAFWDIVPCSLIGVHWRFRGAYCLHHQGNDPQIITTSQDHSVMSFACLSAWTTNAIIQEVIAKPTIVQQFYYSYALLVLQSSLPFVVRSQNVRAGWCTIVYWYSSVKHSRFHRENQRVKSSCFSTHPQRKTSLIWTVEDIFKMLHCIIILDDRLQDL
jgi:hypothetical protein